MEEQRAIVAGEMAIRRAIVVFPNFADPAACEQIEGLRRRFDPLAAMIPVHITLVFPFASTLSADELVAHVQAATRGIAPFPVLLQGITRASLAPRANTSS
jgi:2'-5' RNA ligase